MLELVNRTRANPAAEAARFGMDLNEGLFPGTIAATAKPPLAFHPKLILSARNHSQWMLDTGIFDHTGLNNSTSAERMRDAGYVFSGSSSSGENISLGGTSGTVERVSMTLARHESLFRSPSHRTNICAKNFKEIGLGILQRRFQGFNALMATQNFATSGTFPDPWLLGVVFKDADDDGIYDAGEGLPGVTVTPGRRGPKSRCGGRRDPTSSREPAGKIRHDCQRKERPDQDLPHQPHGHRRAQFDRNSARRKTFARLHLHSPAKHLARPRGYHHHPRDLQAHRQGPQRHHPDPKR
jgi:hypothetical protein